MRRRLSLLSSLVALVLVLALPGATLGASYTYSIQEDTCNASGGDHGYGHLYFEVKMTEYSKSANKFTFTGKAQHREIGGSRWYTDWNYGTYTRYFASNSSNNWYTRWFDYDPDDYGWHRIRVVLKVWHDGLLLASKTVQGEYC